MKVRPLVAALSSTSASGSELMAAYQEATVNGISGLARDSIVTVAFARSIAKVTDENDMDAFFLLLSSNSTHQSDMNLSVLPFDTQKTEQEKYLIKGFIDTIRAPHSPQDVVKYITSACAMEILSPDIKAEFDTLRMLACAHDHRYKVVDIQQAIEKYKTDKSLRFTKALALFGAGSDLFKQVPFVEMRQPYSTKSPGPCYVARAKFPMIDEFRLAALPPLLCFLCFDF